MFIKFLFESHFLLPLEASLWKYSLIFNLEKFVTLNYYLWREILSLNHFRVLILNYFCYIRQQIYR